MFCFDYRVKAKVSFPLVSFRLAFVVEQCIAYAFFLAFRQVNAFLLSMSVDDERMSVFCLLVKVCYVYLCWMKWNTIELFTECSIFYSLEMGSLYVTDFGIGFIEGNLYFCRGLEIWVICWGRKVVYIKSFQSGTASGGSIPRFYTKVEGQNMVHCSIHL